MKSVIPPELIDVLESDPEKVHGAICFRGTRVPVDQLIAYSGEGTGLDEFLDDYPGVPRDWAERVLQYLSSENRRIFRLAS